MAENSYGNQQEKLNRTWQDIWDKETKDRDWKKEIKRHEYERKYFFSLLVKNITKLNIKNPRVLEIGCGTAIDSYILAQKIEAQVTATDLLEESIKVAGDISTLFPKKIKLEIADASNFKYKNDTFDVIFSQGLLEHFKDPDKIIKEQIRILKSGGLLVIDVPQKYNPYTAYKHKKIAQNKWEYGWEREYSFSELKSLEKKYGLKVVDKCGHGYDIKRDYGLGFLRYFPQRLSEKMLIIFPLVWLYDLIWFLPEKFLGYLFMQNIAVVFKK